MSDTRLNALVKQIKDQERMSSEEMLDLRRLIGADLEIDDQEADLLFSLNTPDIAKPADWIDYFVMVLTTFLVEQAQPAGYVSDINASWLIARINHDGIVETESELALLLSVLKFAHNANDALERFALDQVKHAVLNGTGYYGKTQLVQGVIGSAECELITRVIHAAGGDGGIRVSRTEAEFLMDLNEATLERDNSPDWQNLFVRAMANHLMMQSVCFTPTVSEADRRQEWLESQTRTAKRFPGFSDIKAAFAAFFTSQARQLGAAGPASHLEGSVFLDHAAISEAEKITQIEADWLIERLNRDGGIDANERALLEFLKAECPDIHATLHPLLKAA